MPVSSSETDQNVMVPLAWEEELARAIAEQLLAPRPFEVGPLGLRHALAHRLPGVWVDQTRAPRSVLLARAGDGRTEAFGGGTTGRRWPG